MKVRKRTQNGLSKFSYSEKIRVNGEKGTETQRELNARNYIMLVGQKDESRNVVVKERKCFIWEHQSFVLDEIGEGEPFEAGRPLNAFLLFRIQTSFGPFRAQGKCHSIRLHCCT